MLVSSSDVSSLPLHLSPSRDLVKPKGFLKKTARFLALSFLLHLCHSALWIFCNFPLRISHNSSVLASLNCFLSNLIFSLRFKLWVFLWCWDSMRPNLSVTSTNNYCCHEFQSHVQFSFCSHLQYIDNVTIKLLPFPSVASWGLFNPPLGCYTWRLSNVCWEIRGYVVCLLPHLPSLSPACCVCCSFSWHFFWPWCILRPREFLHVLPHEHLFVICISLLVVSVNESWWVSHHPLSWDSLGVYSSVITHSCYWNACKAC